ncbi:hypothetical protein CHY_1260 [Carboxydothermus hydrogenoformans Z-2901]|uniref:Uncharacterized protein n=1 Tax=Carboxydothermus hydrogenoformans (strain ATCC BAA-161 / DSM 6008 / Z-2901) TaxID=246194 RepID=Q3ACP0_CARHZ|nr:hypothetical protein CHY_1260 [Carboxydothermus hydrogenoformans Z-2901]
MEPAPGNAGEGKKTTLKPLMLITTGIKGFFI